MHGAEALVTAEYANIIVGDGLRHNYDPVDAVDLAEAIAADILTVGDSREFVPDDETTMCYLGRLKDNLEAANAADAFLIVGIDITTAETVPWSAVQGHRIVMTTHSTSVYRNATSVPADHYVGNADASTLRELATNVSELASDPATVYSERPDHPDPPVELLSNTDLSVKVKRCKICHTFTNRQISMGNRYPAAAVEWQCPAVAHRNHDRLEKLLDRRKQLDSRRDLYDETTETGQRALERLEAKRTQLTDQIEQLREWFDGRFDDVVATDPDLSGGWQFKQFQPRETQYK